MTSSPALPSAGRALRTLAADLCDGDGAAPFVSRALPAELLDALIADGDACLRERAIVTWETPERRLFGFGEAARLRGGRRESPSDARAAIAAFATSLGDLPRGPGRPRLVGGFAFDPASRVHDARWDSFGGWQFVLPLVVVECVDDAWYGTVTLPADAACSESATAERLAEALFAPHALPAGTHRPAPEGLDCPGWERAVSTVVEAIGDGRFEKVVLARPLAAATTQGKADVLGDLAERYPTTHVFSFAAPDAVWLGATPERLVTLHGGVVRSASLASSRPRGRDAAEDERLGRELFESTKERAEHRFVVEAVREALEPACTMLTVPREPELMKVANIQHLYTPVTGHVREGVDVLELVERMHPTPAVGGWPKHDALAAIRDLEAMDRGWYAGPIGWVDLEGDGEFAVALRSALLTDGEAALYAGAGIVAGSDPAAEFAETELKFRPLLGALGGD